MKETQSQPFDIYSSTRSKESQNILNKLRLARKSLISSLSSKNEDQVRQLLSDFLLHFYGFIVSPDGSPSKLVNMFTFKWTNSLDSKNPSSKDSCLFDLCNVCVNVSFFYSNMAQSSVKGLTISSTSTEEMVKKSFNLLRRSAGVLSFAKNMSTNATDEGKSDASCDVIDMYFNQAMAEAQEIVVERSIRLNHNPSLVAKLANLTSQFYKRSYDVASSVVGGDKGGDHKSYYCWKWKLYLAVGFSFYTVELLTLDKGGEAKCASSRAETYFNEAIKLAVMKEWQTFIMSFHVIIKRHVDRCNMESNMIYSRVKKSEDIPPPGHPEAGAVQLEEIDVSDVSAVWTVAAYDGFAV